MRWSRADLHLHTTCSDGMPAPDVLARRLARSRLAVAAVTDHDRIEGALRVEEALAGSGPEIVIGSEVSSRDGHVLALFVARDVSPGMSAEATIAAIHEQGGLAVAAHPYSLALGVGDVAAQLPFDGVEILNGSPFMEVSDARAVARLARGPAAQLGGSDAHITWQQAGCTRSFRDRERRICGRRCSPVRPTRRWTGPDASRRCPSMCPG